MLGTLLDAAEPGRRRPMRRESVSILVQGLRERLDLRRRRTPGAVWSGGLRIAALVMLGQTFAAVLVTLIQEFFFAEGRPAGMPVDVPPWHAVSVVIGIAAAVALVSGADGRRGDGDGSVGAVPNSADGVLPGQLVTALVILAGLSVLGPDLRPGARLRGLAARRAAGRGVWVGHHLATGDFV